MNPRGNDATVSASDSSNLLRFGWALGVTALMATWITFSSIHRYQTADTLLPVLVSVLKWTPFYWDQDRFGMLIPLLAAPIRSPFANLLFQTWLGSFAGLFATFLVLRYTLGNGPTWLVAGAVVNLTALILLPAQVQCDWFVEPYAPSLTLALSAFLLLEKSSKTRWAIAIFLMTLAHWVNVSAFTLLGPLVILRYLMQKQQSDLNRVLPCLGIGATAGLIMMRASRYRGSTRLGFVPPRDWLNAWAQQAEVISKLQMPHLRIFMWLIVPGAVILLFLLLAKPSLGTKRLVGASAALVGTGVVNWLFMGILVWVRANLYSIRYTLPALLFCVCGLLVLYLPFLQRWVGTNHVFAIAVLLTFLIIHRNYGRPSDAQVRNFINQQFGRMTEDILSSKATLVAGDYWSVWPAVFHADLTLYERGEREVVYGLTGRSSVTTAFWSQMPQSELCVAAPLGDTQAAMYMEVARLHSGRRDEHKTVNIFSLEGESSCHRASRLRTP